MDIARRVEPRQYLIHESLYPFVRTASFEFSDPDRATGSDLASIFDVFLEVNCVRCIIVPASKLALQLQ